MSPGSDRRLSRLGRPLAASVLCCVSHAACAQFLQVDLSNQSVNIAVEQHRFRGLNASLLYTEQNGHQDLLAGAGYTAKSWLLGRAQNFYLSTGAKFYATDVIESYVNTLAWHNVIRFEPRRWQAVELAAVLDYGPSFATFRDGESFWGVAAQLDYTLSHQSNAILGWRRVGVELTGGHEADIERGGYLGLNWLF